MAAVAPSVLLEVRLYGQRAVPYLFQELCMASLSQ